MKLLLFVQHTHIHEFGLLTQFDVWAFAIQRNAPALIYHHYLN